MNAGNLDRIAKALTYIPPNDRDVWLKMAMAVKSLAGEDGFPIWDTWSQGAGSYAAKDAAAVWRSCTGNGAVTGGSLFHEAKQHGWIDDEKTTKPTKKEIAAQQREVAERAAKAATAKAGGHAQAAIKAAEIWSRATPANDHPYLSKKGIQAAGARVLSGDLVIPLYDGSELTSLQFIGADGGKRFLPGARVSGCYFLLGTPDKQVCICEGYSTGVSIFESTQFATAIAFSDTNLMAVAKSLSQRYSNSKIVICGDDDYRKEGNPGLTHARKSAQAVGALIAIPEFGDARPEGTTDFNDLYLLHGGEAVERCVMSAKALDDSQSGSAPESDDAAIQRLAKLTVLDYDRVRDKEAERMRVRVSILDKLIAAKRKDAAEETAAGSIMRAIEPWLEPVDGTALLDEIERTIERHFILPSNNGVKHASKAVVLWVLSAHAIEFLDIAPILAITSPEMRCGKSTLMTIIKRMVPRPLMASNISPTAVFRAMEKWTPTLLIDEADTFLSGDHELRGVLNSGHTRESAFVVRNVAVGDDFEPRQFSTWGAKSIAMIGKLQETLADRSILIQLRRKLPSEVIVRLRHSNPNRFETLKRKCARFIADHAEEIRNAKPTLPDSLPDRAADNWEPLVSIADLAGGKWPKHARDAAESLTGVGGDNASVRVELLKDIHAIFEATKKDRVFTEVLIRLLTTDSEKRWVTYYKDKPITARQIAALLNPFSILSVAMRDGGQTLKGYKKESFHDAFSRYGVVLSVTSLQPNTGAASSHFSCRYTDDNVTDKKQPRMSTGAGCNDVTDKTTPPGEAVYKRHKKPPSDDDFEMI